MNKLFFSIKGSTESLVTIHILDKYTNELKIDTIIRNYKISNFFKGKFFFVRLIKKIFKYKLTNKFTWHSDFWNKINIISVHASISIKNYTNLEQYLIQTCSKNRMKNIYKYKKLIEDGTDLGSPLYITGACLNFLGAKTKSNELFMLDGSRRLLSLVLAKKKSTKLLIIKLKDDEMYLS